jgi:hypothetical protein
MSVQHGIVLGCPRSGTTYLMSVLNTIPNFECLSGTLLPVAIPHVVNQDLDPDVYDALAVGFERAIDAYLHSGRYHSRAAALQKWFRAPTSLTGLFRAMRGDRDMPQRMIYKEPALSFSPEFVLDAFPDAQVVHIYRDGRDCANSLVRSYDVLTDEKLADLKGSEVRLGRKYDHRYVPWWVEEGRDQEFIDSSPYVRSIWMWKYMVRRCHEYFSQPAIQESGQVMLLRYEEFVQDPQTYGRAALDHLGGTPACAFEKRLDQARASSIGKHERRDVKEIESAERVAGEELTLYGYDLHTSHNQ